MRLLLILILTLAFCPIAQAEPKEKSNFLVNFFDINEAAFAYHRHCLNSENSGINVNFIRTSELVADALFADAVRKAPQADAQHIKAKILERRYNIQYKLDHVHMKEGCHSSSVKAARDHYEKFSKLNINEVKKYIEEQTAI